MAKAIKETRKSNTRISKNYDIQGSTSFVIGINPDGTNVLAKKRYQYKNPNALRYKNPNALPYAESLIFSITNYAIDGGVSKNTLYLPSYIKAFQHSDTPQWNETQFLGRPEPLFTYSTGKREGSIEFFILTDYAQMVEYGYNYDAPSQDGSPELKQNFNESFTKKFQNDLIELEKIKTKMFEIQNRKNEYLQKKSFSNSADTTSVEFDEEIEEMNSKINDLDKQYENLLKNNSDLFTPYSESRTSYDNVYYNISKQNSNYNSGYGDISYTLVSTKERLDEMRSTLMFQPAYFSGDKLDFRERLKFIQKCTKPAENKSGSGFAFTKAPVCHLRLGNWLNHDVIISNVNYNYENSPWTLDGSGQVQPMYVSVTLSFSIVSEYHDQNVPRNEIKMVPLANDESGFFGGNQTNNI